MKFDPTKVDQSVEIIVSNKTQIEKLDKAVELSKDELDSISGGYRAIHRAWGWVASGTP